MNIDRIYSALRRFPYYRQYRFNKIISKFNLQLDYLSCRGSIKILEDIFISQEYALGFPFGEDAVVVDLGGHYGFFTIWAHRHLGIGSIIYTVEPNTNNYQLLRSNIKKNNIKQVETFQQAIANRSGMIILYQARESFNHGIIEDVESEKSFTKAQTLGAFLKETKVQKIDFLKIDVEGAEFEILLNSDLKVLEKIRIINMEFHDRRHHDLHFREIENHLVKHNFKLISKNFHKDMSGKGMQFGHAVFKQKE